jgi:hypothetical protein
MERYANLSGNSGVRAYEMNDDSIVIEFVGRAGEAERFYRYSHASAGIGSVCEMKRLAKAGRGLSAYVAQNAPQYASKW